MVGFDPWLHAPVAMDELAKELESKRIKLKPLSKNPVDRVWGRKRPAPPRGALCRIRCKYAGKSAEDKLKELQALLKKDGQDAVVLTFPDSICWLFNIRGSDVAHNPVALAFAIVPASGKARAVRRSGQRSGRRPRPIWRRLPKISEPAALEKRLAR